MGLHGQVDTLRLRAVLRVRVREKLCPASLRTSAIFFVRNVWQIVAKPAENIVELIAGSTTCKADRTRGLQSHKPPIRMSKQTSIVALYLSFRYYRSATANRPQARVFVITWTWESRKLYESLS